LGDPQTDFVIREESQWQYNMGDGKMNGQFERQYYSSLFFCLLWNVRSAFFRKYM